jgi:hypothetical protein
MARRLGVVSEIRKVFLNSCTIKKGNGTTYILTRFDLTTRKIQKRNIIVVYARQIDRIPKHNITSA